MRKGDFVAVCKKKHLFYGYTGTLMSPYMASSTGKGVKSKYWMVKILVHDIPKEIEGDLSNGVFRIAQRFLGKVNKPHPEKKRIAKKKKNSQKKKDFVFSEFYLNNEKI